MVAFALNMGMPMRLQLFPGNQKGCTEVKVIDNFGTQFEVTLCLDNFFFFNFVRKNV